MKKLHFNCFVVIFTLLLCTFDGFAQIVWRQGMTQEFKNNPAKKEQWIRETRERLISEGKLNPQTKSPCYTYQQMFDSLRLNRGEEAAAFAERRFIEKGDSVRIKFVFNNRIVEHISVEGAESQMTDIRNGVFVATVKPEKSRLVEATLQRRDSYTGKPKRPVHITFIIMVFDSKEYKKVAAKVKKFEDEGDADGRAEYLFSLERKLGLKLR